MNANWNRGQLKMYHPYNGSVNILLHQEIYKKMSTIVKMVLITCLGLIVSVLTSSYSSHQFIFVSTNNEDSQDSKRSQVRASVCYILYMIIYQYKEQLTIVDI
jgi:capsular polysaccharide biosynthesis protein